MLDQTLGVVKRLGLTYGLLEKHFDVDDIGDLLRLRQCLGKYKRVGLQELDYLRDRLDELSLNWK